MKKMKRLLVLLIAAALTMSMTATILADAIPGVQTDPAIETSVETSAVETAEEENSEEESADAESQTESSEDSGSQPEESSAVESQPDASTEETLEIQPSEPETESVAPTTAAALTGKWVERDGKYYWRWSDGTYCKDKGWKKLGGKQYYLGKGGYRVTGWKTIDEKRYYFNSKGVLYEKTGWQTISNKTYYFKSKHYAVTGIYKIGKKNYCFSSKGVLQKNLRAEKVGKYYYNVNSKGAATRITKNEALSIRDALKFIEKRASKGKTNAEKLRLCFKYMVGHMKYNPGYYRWSGDKKYFEDKDGLYQLAREMFESSVFRGNCHRFAACFAACAKELGYTAYVVTTTGDHSFVMIDGKYYDNMGSIYGAKTHSKYTTYKKQKM